MSLEQKIEVLTAAIEANTAALLAAAGGEAAEKPAATKPAAGKTGGAKSGAAGKTTAKKVSADEARAVLVKIKDEFDIAEARKVLEKHSLAKMAEVSDENAAAVLADATKHLEALRNGGGDEEEAGDDL